MTSTTYASVLALVVAALLLGATSPAEAIFIETPLALEAEADHAEVGDDVDFAISPHNETARQAQAGKSVKVGFSYDKNEQGGGPDAPSDDTGYTEGTILGGLALDDQARASFTWTVPAEVADRNVNLFLEDSAGERLAFAYVAIGNATPMMHLMNGPADDGREPAGEIGDGSEDEPDSAETSALGAVALLGVLGSAGVAFAYVRRK